MNFRWPKREARGLLQRKAVNQVIQAMKVFFNESKRIADLD